MIGCGTCFKNEHRPAAFWCLPLQVQTFEWTYTFKGPDTIGHFKPLVARKQVLSSIVRSVEIAREDHTDLPDEQDSTHGR